MFIEPHCVLEPTLDVGDKEVETTAGVDRKHSFIMNR